MFICEWIYYIHQLHNVSLTQSVSTSVTTSHTPNHPLLRPPTTILLLCPILETHNRHPGVPTLVISDWSLVVFLTSDWIVVADCFGPIKKFVSSSAFYSFKTNFFGGWVGGGSDVKMGCTIYWKIFPRS